MNKISLSKLKDLIDTQNCSVVKELVVFLTSVVYFTLYKQNVDYVSFYMNINSVFEIKKPKNPPLLNLAGKVSTSFIIILTKLFANPILFLNFTSLKHSMFTKIIIRCFRQPSFIRLLKMLH